MSVVGQYEERVGMCEEPTPLDFIFFLELHFCDAVSAAEPDGGDTRQSRRVRLYSKFTSICTSTTEGDRRFAHFVHMVAPF
jgi:hypothetical protein